MENRGIKVEPTLATWRQSNPPSDRVELGHREQHIEAEIRIQNSQSSLVSLAVVSGPPTSLSRHPMLPVCAEHHREVGWERKSNGDREVKTEQYVLYI